MEQIPSFNALIQKSVIDNWDRDALTDFKGQTLQFHDVARKIEKLHILFENSGIQKGDKIAMCGRNSSFSLPSPMEPLLFPSCTSLTLNKFITSLIILRPACFSWAIM